MTIPEEEEIEVEMEKEVMEKREVEKEVEEEKPVPRVRALYKHQGQGMGFEKGEVQTSSHYYDNNNAAQTFLRYLYLCQNQILTGGVSSK